MEMDEIWRGCQPTTTKWYNYKLVVGLYYKYKLVVVVVEIWRGCPPTTNDYKYYHHYHHYHHNLKPQPQPRSVGWISMTTPTGKWRRLSCARCYSITLTRSSSSSSSSSSNSSCCSSSLWWVVWISMTTPTAQGAFLPSPSSPTHTKCRVVLA